MASPLAASLEAFREHVETHRRYLLTTHVGPDGDGLGSALALAALLRAKGREAMLAIVDPLPEKYAFMLEGFPPGTLKSFPQQVGSEELRSFDTVVLLDCGELSRLGPLLGALDLARQGLVILDHHVPKGSVAGVEVLVLDEKASATANLIHALYRLMDVEIQPPAARALYVAFVTETGSFRFSNTNPELLRIVADLLEKGVRTDKVYQQLWERKPLSALGLVGHGLANLRTASGGRVVFTSLDAAAFDRYGAVPEDADGLVNQILALDGAEVAIVAYVKVSTGEIKMSFRSKNDVDVQKVAATFGGGGHRKAAGATAHGELEKVCAQAVEAASRAVEGDLGPARAGATR